MTNRIRNDLIVIVTDSVKENMRNTVQRDLIYKVVCDSSDHPSAEVVYDRARAVMPNISLGTVYRNLKLLVALGKVREIPLGPGGSRFDKTVVAHAHFRCRLCGEVTDAELGSVDALADALRRASGNEPESTEIMFTGVCRKCVGKENKAV